MAFDQTTIGRRLKEARTNCGLTQEAAAEAVGIPRTAVVAVEAGKRSLSTLELSQFAKLYHRPVAHFFEEEPASVVEPADLILARQLPGYEDNQLVKDAVARCSEICQIAIELETLLDRRPRIAMPTYNLPAPKRAEEAIEQGILVAEEERRRLGLGFAPIADVSDLINTQGIWASGFDLPPEMSGLFLRYSSVRSIIIVKLDHPRTRKRFSYAHEYGHAILDRGMTAIVSTDRNSHDLVEKRANAFAAAFLMPQAGVHWLLSLLDKGGASRRHQHVYDVAREEEVDAERRAAPKSQRISFKDAAMLAHHFGTSYESAVYRLRDLRVIRPAERESLLDEAQRAAAREFIELFYPPKKSEPDRELVMEVANLAIEAFQREEVSAGYLRDLGEKLGISGAKLVELAQTAAYD
ncbi:helix-turn-helix domain-containing protein [Paludisphaera rhizosphaerae]|uniref:helix-turn-helix domain-containing protein n=1 Tax=Paludisphaera rhizosphaerae TaxID=2711216 RepID=UPI0013ECA312|nr:XRE family transcriptional regulator [Paludisphaera rhizosphaerae]